MAAVAGPSEIEAGSPVETRLWDALGRWSASVLVEGKAAEIYQVEHKPDSTACYIEAVDGKEFTAIFRRERADATDQSLHLCIDGSNVDAFFLNSGNKADAVFSGARVSALEERPFLFAPIPLTDDADQADANEAVIKGLGTIRFDVRRVKRRGTVAPAAAQRSAVKQHVCSIALSRFAWDRRHN